MERRQLRAGESLIAQGDAPDNLFLIDTGQVSALVEQPGRDPVRLETLRAGRAVGELGFYLGTSRSAAVVADRDSWVYVLSREALARMEAENPQVAAGLHHLIAHLLGERVLHLMRVVDGLQQ
jgi:SulP family sulfate permease